MKVKGTFSRNGSLIVRDVGTLIFEELLRRGHAVRDYEMKHSNSVTLTISVGLDTTESIGSENRFRKVVITHTWDPDEGYDIDAIDDFMNGKKSSLQAKCDMHEALE